MSDDASPFDNFLQSTGLAEILAPAKTTPAMRDALTRAIPLMELPPPEVAAVHDLHIAGGKGPLVEAGGGMTAILPSPPPGGGGNRVAPAPPGKG